MKRIIYDIIKDGDRHLRGRIAELIFERVKQRLLNGSLCCCTTLELHQFFDYGPRLVDSFSINKNSLLSEYMTNLKAVMNLLGIKKSKKASTMLLSDHVKRKLRRLCLFCLEESEAYVGVWVDNYRRYFRLCRRCLNKCIKKGLVRISSAAFLGYEVDPRNETFNRLVKGLLKVAELVELATNYQNVIEVLSRLDVSAQAFLNSLYKRVGAQYGQHSFDYLCVDEHGGKYMVDVTSVRGIGKAPAKLSARERQIAEQAKKEGFKILVPTVRFLENWQVMVELVEE
jgi:hypothetical protein